MRDGAVVEQMREQASSRSSRLRQPRKGSKRDHGFAKSPQAMEEDVKRETREKKRKVEDVKRMRRIVRENNKNKDPMRHDEQELLSVWEGWHWDDNKGWVA